MKKLISMILALAMIFSLSITAMAEEVEEVIKESLTDTTINVGAEYVGTEAGEIATVYFVKVEWTAGDNTLTYTNNATSYSWDAEHMKYVVTNAEAVQGNGWSGSAAYTIKATNQSNAAVDATITVAGLNDINVTGNFGEAGNVLKLANAAAGVGFGAEDVGSPKEASVGVTVTASGEKGITQAGNIATITITLTDATPAAGE